MNEKAEKRAQSLGKIVDPKSGDKRPRVQYEKFQDRDGHWQENLRSMISSLEAERKRFKLGISEKTSLEFETKKEEVEF